MMHSHTNTTSDSLDNSGSGIIVLPPHGVVKWGHVTFFRERWEWPGSLRSTAGGNWCTNRPLVLTPT